MTSKPENPKNQVKNIVCNGPKACFKIVKIIEIFYTKFEQYNVMF